MPRLTILRRAFVTNLGKVSATSSERARLEAAGIHEPTIQHYLAWRRSMLVMVVFVTIAGAALTTFLTLTRTDDRSLCSALTTRLLPNTKDPLSKASGTLPELDDDEAKEELLAKGKDLLEDAKKMASTAVDSEHSGGKPDVEKLLVKKALADAASGLAESEDENEKGTTVFGMFADSVHLVSLYAVPLATIAALSWWIRFRLTFRILVIGWAFSFFMPMLIALCPWSWWGYVEPSAAPGKQGPQYYTAMIEGFLEGIDYLIALLPTVLSLIPGVQRACLRVKTLLPESMLPGWFLVAAGPLYALFLLVVFVAINQIASNPVFCVGMFFLVASPMVYVVRAELVTRPLIDDDDRRRMRRIQRIASGLTILGCIILIAYLTTRKVLGIQLVGLNPETSLLRPMDVLEYALEFVGRLLFMTVLGADLFMRMNLAAWNNFGRFMRSDKVADYDRVMRAMERISQ